jgi:hypothetical protein
MVMTGFASPVWSSVNCYDFRETRMGLHRLPPPPFQRVKCRPLTGNGGHQSATGQTIFEIEVKEGKVIFEHRLIVSARRDQITLKTVSNRSDEIHLHVIPEVDPP